MSQDLDQILLLVGSVLAGGFALLFLLAWLEPQRPELVVSTDAPPSPLDLPERPR